MRAIPVWWHGQNGYDFWADYDAGNWEPKTRDTIYRYVKPSSTYLDIGAWIGPTVLWAAPIARRVVAVEPDPVARGCLYRNIADYTNVEVVAGAVDVATGTAQLMPHREGFGSSMSRLNDGFMIADNWQPHQGVSVRTWTVPDLFDCFGLENVDLVKMDIEGGEALVLEETCAFLLEQRIPLLVSLHEDWWAHPVRQQWFAGFELHGTFGGFEPILATPR